MKKLFLLIGMAGTLLLCGCCKLHDWEPATCTEPETCSICGETRGEPTGHIFTDPTCLEPMHCTVCGLSTGECSDHLWEKPNCEHAYRCSVCGKEVGKPLDHIWSEANYQQPKACSVCGEIEGDPLLSGFTELGVKCTMEFNQRVPLCTVTMVPGLYTDGSAIITKAGPVSEYNGTVLPVADGCTWYCFHAEFTVNDFNAQTNGYSVGFCCEDYYTPDRRDAPTGTLPITENVTADRYTVSWYGSEYTDCLGFSVVEKGLMTDSGATLKADCYVRVPTGYDGIVIGFYNNESVMNRPTAAFAEYAGAQGVYFRYIPETASAEQAG